MQRSAEVPVIRNAMFSFLLSITIQMVQKLGFWWVEFAKLHLNP